MLNMDVLQNRMFQSSLLLGFAMAITISLIAMRDTRWRTKITLIIFACATFLLLIDNYSMTRLLTEFGGLAQRWRRRWRRNIWGYMNLAA